MSGAIKNIGQTRLITPGLDKFTEFLKSCESRWRVKLERRFDRERYVGGKGESSPGHKLPRYILSMFPYPSGRLHLGHVRIYTSGDILARYSRLMSKNEDSAKEFEHVINPMGFDSFGLPAENAAKERGLNPADWTNSNIRAMKRQLDDLALQFDWREATSNPSFYKWTQEIFLRLMDAGLVYKSFAQVNWDPVDKTVLADEQVDEEGRSWRSGALVEKRNYRQWFVKVNAFTNDIYTASDVDPDSWRDVLAIQRNWIGQPCGWLFYLPILNDAAASSPDILPIFTKNPELFMSAKTRLIIAREHWLEKVHHISEIGFVKNPFTGGVLEISLTDNIEDLPSNSLATLANPASQGSSDQDSNNLEEKLDRDQVLLQAKLHGLGGYYTSDTYRDWLISRQRYWGTPIPAVHCDSCGYQGVTKESLPVKLPHVSNMSLKLQPHNNSDELVPPIEQIAPENWLETDCPSCGSKAKRECETFDTLFDSSWYFLRYATQPPEDKPFDPERVQPVWCYVGGKEHAAMHLFYARFVTHFLHSQGQLGFKEPFNKLLVQGVVKSRTYKLDGKYLSQSEVDAMDDKSKVVIEYEKMSKSKGNGVDPQDLLDRYGIDATRFCLMSYVNPRTERLWRSQDEEFRDVLLYLRRLTLTVQEYYDIGDKLRSGAESKEIKELDKDELEAKKSLFVQTRNKCSVDAIFHIQEAYQFRQYISVLHSLLGPIRANIKTSAIYTKEFAETLASLLVMLNPIAPHLSEELWSHFSKCIINPLRTGSDSPYNVSLQASDQPWPVPDKDYPFLVKWRAENRRRLADEKKKSKDSSIK